jgi:hypothetical protein
VYVLPDEAGEVPAWPITSACAGTRVHAEVDTPLGEGGWVAGWQGEWEMGEGGGGGWG